LFGGIGGGVLAEIATPEGRKGEAVEGGDGAAVVDDDEVTDDGGDGPWDEVSGEGFVGRGFEGDGVFDGGVGRHERGLRRAADERVEGRHDRGIERRAPD
jgi:hypothetical protein